MVLVSSDLEDGPGRDERDERWARLDCPRPGYFVLSRRRPTTTTTTAAAGTTARAETTMSPSRTTATTVRAGEMSEGAVQGPQGEYSPSRRPTRQLTTPPST